MPRKHLIIYGLLQVQITVLDKNDSPPSFKDLPMHYTVSEDLGPGQSVATVKADDPDSIGELRYSIIKGNDGHFAIDEESGVLQLVEALDRETEDVYRLTVRSGDGNQFTDATVTIEVSEKFYAYEGIATLCFDDYDINQ